MTEIERERHLAPTLLSGAAWSPPARPGAQHDLTTSLELPTMRVRPFAYHLVAIGVLTISLACSRDIPSAPEMTPRPIAPNADLLGLSFLTHGLLRNTPLATDITVQAAIGSAGGTLSIPSAGVTLTVPAGAVSS